MKEVAALFLFWNPLEIPGVEDHILSVLPSLWFFFPCYLMGVPLTKSLKHCPAWLIMRMTSAFKSFLSGYLDILLKCKAVFLHQENVLWWPWRAWVTALFHETFADPDKILQQVFLFPCSVWNWNVFNLWRSKVALGEEIYNPGGRAVLANAGRAWLREYASPYHPYFCLVVDWPVLL